MKTNTIKKHIVMSRKGGKKRRNDKKSGVREERNVNKTMVGNGRKSMERGIKCKN